MKTGRQEGLGLDRVALDDPPSECPLGPYRDRVSLHNRVGEPRLIEEVGHTTPHQTEPDHDDVPVDVLGTFRRRNRRDHQSRALRPIRRPIQLNLMASIGSVADLIRRRIQPEPRRTPALQRCRQPVVVGRNAHPAPPLTSDYCEPVRRVMRVCPRTSESPPPQDRTNR